MIVAPRRLTDARREICRGCSRVASCPEARRADDSAASCPIGIWPAPTAEDYGPRRRGSTPPVASVIDAPLAEPPWAEAVRVWGDLAETCPRRKEVPWCCGSTTFRCIGGRRAGQYVHSIRDCAECFAEHGPIPPEA